jgi:hypothetical protein
MSREQEPADAFDQHAVPYPANRQACFDGSIRVDESAGTHRANPFRNGSESPDRIMRYGISKIDR